MPDELYLCYARLPHLQISEDGCEYYGSHDSSRHLQHVPDLQQLGTGQGIGNCWSSPSTLRAIVLEIRMAILSAVQLESYCASRSRLGSGMDGVPGA